MTTLDVAPQMLSQVMAALPSNVRIAGSRDADPYVRLVLEGRDLPDGPVMIIVRHDGLVTTLEIKPVAVPAFAA